MTRIPGGIRGGTLTPSASPTRGERNSVGGRPSPGSPGARGARAVALTALAWLTLPLPATAADPFYLELLRSGRESYARKDFRGAVADLRLACFGFLEEPPVLREGLARLALAQAAAGDGDGFLSSFSRIADLERRFASLATTALPEDVAGPFDASALERVPAAQLAAVPRLAELVAQRADRMLAELPPRQRRAELEKRAAAEPANARWGLELARADLNAGKAEAAGKRLATLLVGDPANAEARCLSGLVLAETRKCEAAVATLRTCAASLSDRGLAAARLQCLVKTTAWAEGSEVLAALPEAVRRDPEIAKLAAKIVAGSAAAAPKAVAAPAPQPATAPAKPPAKPAAKPAVKPPAKPPAADRRAPRTTVKPADPPVTAPAQPPAASEPAATATAKPTPRRNRSASKPAEKPPAASSAPAPAAPPIPSTPSPAEPPPVVAPAAAAAATPEAPAIVPTPPTPDEREQLEVARQLMAEARLAGDLVEALRLAAAVADRHPKDREAQLLAGEIAYRASKWTEAARYFRTVDPGDRQPALLFYFAVALFESGDRAGAQATLKRCLPDLQRTPIVAAYVEKILGIASPR